jgi:hypothetical protein
MQLVRSKSRSARSTVRHNSDNGLDVDSWATAKVRVPVQCFGIPYPFNTSTNMYMLWNGGEAELSFVLFTFYYILIEHSQ